MKDVFFVVCDGLKGLPDVAADVWPQARVQTCVIHLIRNSFRIASKRDWDALKKDLKPGYAAATVTAAEVALDELEERWGKQYSSMIRLWRNAWEEFTPFLDYGGRCRIRLCVRHVFG